jgi:Transketolase, thiamine diphosphate binding domain
MNRDLDQLCINTARVLSVDMSEKARAGHPGLPLGAVPWPTPYGTGFCDIIPQTLGAPIATVSSCGRACDWGMARLKG